MRWDLFRNIVACESYSCEAKVLHSMVDRESNSRVYPYVAEWHNTNRLLGKVVRPYSSGALSTTRFVFQGVKTVSDCVDMCVNVHAAWVMAHQSACVRVCRVSLEPQVAVWLH